MNPKNEETLIRDLAELIRIRDDDGDSISPIVCVVDISYDRAEYAARRIVHELKKGSIDSLTLDK